MLDRQSPTPERALGWGRTAAAESATAREENVAEPLDRVELVARLGRNVWVLAEVAALFLEDYPRCLEMVEEHLRQRDAHALYLTAHLLRGSLGALAARPACAVARRLEESARTGDFEAAAADAAGLRTALARLQPILADLAVPGH